MGYFPFFIEIKHTRWVIAGGGRVALRKTKELLSLEADVTVIAPSIHKELEQLAAKEKESLSLIQREIKEEDVSGADYVIAAASAPHINQRVAGWCKDRRIPVNVADQKELCTFLFPSILTDEAVTIGISTGGNSPALSAYLKKVIKKALPSGIGRLAEQLGTARAQVCRQDAEIRRDIFYALLHRGLDNGCSLTEEMTENIIKERLEQSHE